MKIRARTVPEYLKSLPPDRRKIINKLRALVREAAPGAGETMRYGMPTYELNGPLCALASQKNYLSLYIFDEEVMAKYRKNLKGLSLGKCCIRFKKIEALPPPTVRQMLEECVRNLSDDG